MELLHELPMMSQMHEDAEAYCQVGVYFSALKTLCEIGGEDCELTHIFFGTTDEREPKFCAYHFFKYIHGADGQSYFRSQFGKQEQSQCSICGDDIYGTVQVHHHNEKCKKCGYEIIATQAHDCKTK